MSSLVPDETLLAGLGAGDADLAAAFVRRFQGLVFGVALTVLGDTGAAEDIAQLAFERAWRYAPAFDPRRGSVRGWLTTITHNLAVDAIRASRSALVDTTDLTEVLTEISDTPEALAIASDRASGLRRALRGLPPEQARAVAMAGIYGMTAREIAVAEGVPLGTAKTRIRYGMHKLKDALVPDDVGDE